MGYDLGFLQHISLPWCIHKCQISSFKSILIFVEIASLGAKKKKKKKNGITENLIKSDS